MTDGNDEKEDESHYPGAKVVIATTIAVVLSVFLASLVNHAFRQASPSTYWKKNTAVISCVLGLLPWT